MRLGDGGGWGGGGGGGGGEGGGAGCFLQIDPGALPFTKEWEAGSPSSVECT